MWSWAPSTSRRLPVRLCEPFVPELFYACDKWATNRHSQVNREADVKQAEVFHTLLARQRAALCDHLDQEAVKLALYERTGDTASVRRKRLRIKEIGAEIRDIDRMMPGLRVQLLGVEQKRRAV